MGEQGRLHVLGLGPGHVREGRLCDNNQVCHDLGEQGRAPGARGPDAASQAGTELGAAARDIAKGDADGGGDVGGLRFARRGSWADAAHALGGERSFPAPERPAAEAERASGCVLMEFEDV